MATFVVGNLFLKQTCCLSYVDLTLLNYRKQSFRLLRHIYDLVRQIDIYVLQLIVWIRHYDEMRETDR